MAFPIDFLDLEDIGREVDLTLRGGVRHRGTIKGIHAVTLPSGEVEVSVDTDEFEDLVLQPDSYIEYADDEV